MKVIKIVFTFLVKEWLKTEKARPKALTQQPESYFLMEKSNKWDTG
jgi:hypothetical protein